ncbi:MAG: ATP-binding protein, partial [Deinococcales bacterium]
FNKVGVMDLEGFYPAKERFELAMSINNLLASPGFAAWMEGEPLEVKNFLWTSEGKPRLSVFSIAHLSDPERMFFVSSLLNAMLSWMRQQSGTPSLRAILYMDEIFGYFPPNGNPPSKTPMLTLLKQARAFGLGLVLATQNPVDLDYKGLSNIGTWFIGRLQTENDKVRVLEALSSTGANPAEMEKMLLSLGKRVFLLHSMNAAKPVTFQTRWTMSYLAGPVTLEQIKTLMKSQRSVAAATKTTVLKSPSVQTAPASTQPVLPPAIKQYFLPAKAEEITYYPMLFAGARLRYASSKQKLDLLTNKQFLVGISDDPVPVVWDDAQTIRFDVNSLQTEPLERAAFAEVPSSASNPKNFEKWQKDFAKWLGTSQPLRLFYSAKYKTTSEPNEPESDFRIRLSQIARESRDALASELEDKYAPKLQKLEQRLLVAKQKRAEQAAQAQQAQLQAVINVGAGVLGALFGGGRKSAIVSKVGMGMRGASKALKEGQDVGRAAQTVEEIENELEELRAELHNELENAGAIDPNETLETIEIKAKNADISVEVFVLAWVPHTRDDKGRLTAAYL